MQCYRYLVVISIANKEKPGAGRSYCSSQLGACIGAQLAHPRPEGRPEPEPDKGVRDPPPPGGLAPRGVPESLLRHGRGEAVTRGGLVSAVC